MAVAMGFQWAEWPVSIWSLWQQERAGYAGWQLPKQLCIWRAMALVAPLIDQSLPLIGRKSHF